MTSHRGGGGAAPRSRAVRGAAWRGRGAQTHKTNSILGTKGEQVTVPNSEKRYLKTNRHDVPQIFANVGFYTVENEHSQIWQFWGEI